MEDLKSLMSCLDEISSKIGDGMYLQMADKLKNIHNKLNGNKPFHEDTFYYSDEDEDDDSDSDYEVQIRETVERGRAVARAAREAADPERTRRIEQARAKILQIVRRMHDEFKHLRKWEKMVEDRVPHMKRMTASRKNRAIQRWCEKNAGRCPSGIAGDLIGCGRIITGSIFWNWKNLMENGLHAIVVEIGTEEEIARAERGFICYDDISPATLKKLPAFEKKIYADYMKEENDKYHAGAEEMLRVHRFKMHEYETSATDEEIKLRGLGATVYERDHWRISTNEFWANVDGPMVDDA